MSHSNVSSNSISQTSLPPVMFVDYERIMRLRPRYSKGVSFLNSISVVLTDSCVLSAVNILIMDAHSLSIEPWYIYPLARRDGIATGKSAPFLRFPFYFPHDYFESRTSPNVR